MRKDSDFLNQFASRLRALIDKGMIPTEISKKAKQSRLSFLDAVGVISSAYLIDPDAARIWLSRDPLWMADAEVYETQADFFMDILLEGAEIDERELSDEELKAEMNILYPLCLYPDGPPL